MWFEILMIVTAIWDVILYCLVDRFQNSGGPSASIFIAKELKGGPYSWRH